MPYSIKNGNRKKGISDVFTIQGSRKRILRTLMRVKSPAYNSNTDAHIIILEVSCFIDNFACGILSDYT